MIEQANPWVVQAPKKKYEELPEASYMVRFKGIEDYEMKVGDKPPEPKWKFVWEVVSGNHAGKVTDTLTDKVISTNSLPGKLIKGLLGRELVEGEDVQALIGGCKDKTYLGVVEKGKQGGKPAVRTITLPPQM